MAEQIVEVVERWAEALRRGELAEEIWDENAEIVNAEGWVLDVTYRGREGVRKWWDDIAEAVSDLVLDFEEITALDHERVLTAQRFVGHFRTTGIPVDVTWASVITVRSGRIVHAIGYLTKNQALEATGHATGTD
jgi:ketosteroid isomerase-like protein